MSPEGKQLVADVKQLGGTAQLMVQYHRSFGFLQKEELFTVSFNRAPIHDESFGRFLAIHGERLWWLDLRRTTISNNGLRHRAHARRLEHLILGNDNSSASRCFNFPHSPITDAGLINLKAIPRLWDLSLYDLPITDAGLTYLKEMPSLNSLG
jgi:hypothetical protein